MESKIELYLGDCLEIMPTLTAESVDAVITDPPYPDIEKNFAITPICFLNDWICLQIIFWSRKSVFPLSYTAVHKWDKMLGVKRPELIYERYGQKNSKIYRKHAINSSYAAMRSKDVYTDHPTQKPAQLMRLLIEDYTNLNDLIIDPFMGSGTTGVACIQTGRNFIGIEIEPKYFEIAEKRIKEAQLQMRFDL